MKDEEKWIVKRNEILAGQISIDETLEEIIKRMNVILEI